MTFTLTHSALLFSVVTFCTTGIKPSALPSAGNRSNPALPSPTLLQLEGYTLFFCTQEASLRQGWEPLAQPAPNNMLLKRPHTLLVSATCPAVNTYIHPFVLPSVVPIRKVGEQARLEGFKISSISTHCRFVKPVERIFEQRIWVRCGCGSAVEI